jgi:ATP-dependent DNA helicase RecQ
MVAGRYLNLDVAGYGGLSLYPKGQEIIDGSRLFSYRSDVIKSIDKKKNKSFEKFSSDNLTIEKSELLAGLKEKLRELARKRRVPPYMIFSDRSLEGMAHCQPTDEISFAAIHGVGAAKLKDFSADFIGVINNFIGK